ncbi:hypothetical protein LCGC14_3026760 [marine sediment metagenome]|uniref:Ribosomal protein L7/L12 C-terminal domain-containing protein n=1 Tax=marine sediment metagenome TaxID=412755 RepID=A0A0F8WTZ2_9ZZZZ
MKSLERKIKDLIQQRQFVEAVKLHRQATGSGLKEAAAYCRKIRGH